MYPKSHRHTPAAAQCFATQPSSFNSFTKTCGNIPSGKKKQQKSTWLRNFKPNPVSLESSAGSEQASRMRSSRTGALQGLEQHWRHTVAAHLKSSLNSQIQKPPNLGRAQRAVSVRCTTAQNGCGQPAAGRAGVLTPASDFWIFSLALAMSRRIVLAPFSCKQRRKNQECGGFY